jgi:hypothetical protein
MQGLFIKFCLVYATEMWGKPEGVEIEWEISASALHY